MLGSLSDYQTGTTSVHVVCSGSNLFNVSVFKETTLPSELLSFSANIHNTQNILTWKTGSEFNTEWQLIERTSEIFNWEKAGKIKAAGFTNHPVEYQWLDPLPFAITYYRIKTVDFDGSVSISPVQVVERSARTGKNLLVFPNPFKDGINPDYSSLSDE